MTYEEEMKEGWICAIYLHSMCKKMEIFPIRSSRSIKLVVDRLRMQSGTILADETEFLDDISKNEFHPNNEQLDTCEVFFEELSIHSGSVIESLFLDYVRVELSNERSRLRNNKLEDLGI